MDGQHFVVNHTSSLLCLNVHKSDVKVSQGSMADDSFALVYRANEYYQPEGLKAASIPSLQRLCERSLAESAVEPRTCLQIMEYADACGAEVLKQFCLGVGPLCSHMLPVLLCYTGLCQALLPAVLPRVTSPLPPHAL